MRGKPTRKAKVLVIIAIAMLEQACDASVRKTPHRPARAANRLSR
jgi:hypothetical protein